MTLNIKVPITKSKAREIGYKYGRFKDRIGRLFMIILVFGVSLFFATLICGMMGMLLMITFNGGVAPTKSFYDAFMSPIPIVFAIIGDVVLLKILIHEFDLISLQYRDDEVPEKEPVKVKPL